MYLEPDPASFDGEVARLRGEPNRSGGPTKIAHGGPRWRSATVMELHQALVSQGDLYEALARALPDPGTVVFTDTSILFWLYSLGKTARAEFMAWADTDVAGRFKVPVWGAHELHSHMVANPGKLTPLHGEIKVVSAKMRELRRVVSLLAEEVNRPGLLDRREYIGELERVADRFIALCNMAGTQQPWAQLSKEIVPFINRNVLESDIFPALRWIQGDYSARAVGKVPPGYKDEKKPDNKFGDLMLWNEVVAFCKTQEHVTTAILLTDDNKSDWVFRPQTVLDQVGEPHPNRKEEGYETLLAPPLLTHELATGSGVRQFYIVNTSALAIVLERYAGRPIPALFAAVQPVLPRSGWRAPKSLADGAAPSGGDGALDTSERGEPSPAAPVVLPMENLSRPEADLVEAAPNLGSVLAGLRSRDAGLQEEALRVVEQGAALAGAPPAAFFLIGQATSEATRSELQTASNFVHRFETVTQTVGDEARLAVFAGLLFDLYFTPTGARRPLPLDGDVEAIFGVIARSAMAPAVALIEIQLAPNRAHYLVTPGDPVRKIQLGLSLTRTPRGGPSELTQIRRGETDLLEDLPEGAQDLLSEKVHPANSGTVADVVSATARRYSVPLDWIEADQPGEAQVFWAETRGFKDL